MIISQKIRIYPNKTMEKQFNQFFGYARYSFNTGLALWNEMYEDGLKPSEYKVRNEHKRNRKEEWESGYSPNIFDNALTFMARGWKNFFEGRTNRPKFKSKRKSRRSFTMNRKNDSTIRIINGRLYLPKFKYGVKMSEGIQYEGTIKMVTVSERAGKYFASFNIETDEEFYHSNSDLPSVGIDLNIGHFNTSDGEVFYPPTDKLVPLYEKISFYQRSLSRKEHGSNKYNVTKTKLQRLYLKIQNIQDDWLHKLTTYLVTKYHTIGIENLNVQGMLSNRRISKVISRSLFYRFRMFMTYKSGIYGNNLVIVDRWFPSTQTCSMCGFRKEGEDKLKLSDRTYDCDNCGESLDRDYNSACNLKLYAERVG